MQNNSLYLNYFLIKNNDSSFYKIDAQKVSYGFAGIYFQVFDEKTPLNGASISLRDKDFNIIISAATLSNGTANLTVGKIANIEYLTVEYIGYNQVIIPYSKFNEKKSDVFVNLKPQKIKIMDPHTEVYRVLNFDDSTLTLLNADKEELTFKKAKL